MEMIALITFAKGTITCSNKDLPLGSLPHNNVICVTMISLKKHVPFALINDGSTVSIYDFPELHCVKEKVILMTIGERSAYYCKRRFVHIRWGQPT